MSKRTDEFVPESKEPCGVPAPPQRGGLSAFWMMVIMTVCSVVTQVALNYGPKWHASWVAARKAAPEDASKLALKLGDRLDELERWKIYGGQYKDDSMSDGTFELCNVDTEAYFFVRLLENKKPGQGRQPPKLEEGVWTPPGDSVKFTAAEKKFLQRKAQELAPRVRKRQLDLVAEGLE
jgi:hypothetical protein